MLRKKLEAPLPVALNNTQFHPANFAEIGFAGSELISLYALDCALNQGLATGRTLMGEKMRTLPLGTVQAAIPPGYQHPWWSKVNHPGRPRTYPLLLGYTTVPGQYILVAGSELVHAAAVAGKAQIECVVIPYDTARGIGRALIDDFEAPPNGQVTLAETTPAAGVPKQPYVGNKPLRPKGPAVSQTGITHGLNPRANLLLPLAIHSTTVEDGNVIVRANSVCGNGSGSNMLPLGDQRGLDIFIIRASREAGAAGISLHEFALTMLLYQLFRRVKKMAPVKDRRRAGHSIVEGKRDAGHWPGSPRSFQNWVEVRKSLFVCSNEFWNKAIPDVLFERCVALRYGVADPTPAQLEAYLFVLIQAAFKVLDLAGRQTSNLRDLHRANYTSNPRPIPRRVVNQAVDGVPHPGIGESHQVNEIDRFMLAVLGRVNPAKVWRDKAHQTLTFQWLIAIGDLARTGKMIVTCLMAQELILVDRERRLSRNIDAGWIVFDAILALAVNERCSWNKAQRELLFLCRHAMLGGHAMIVSRTSWGKAVLVAKPLDEAASRAAETPILLF